MIIVGAYVIGKEKIWSAIADRFQYRVWLEPNRRKAVDCYEDENLSRMLVENPVDAKIHVLGLQNLNYDYLRQYMSQYDEIFTHVLAIRPSGWEKNSRPQRRGNVWIYGVPYSEHSGFNELRRFVRFLQPETVISTVPTGKNLSNTPKIPDSWLNKEVKPFSGGQQLTITSFLKTKKSVAIELPMCTNEEEELLNFTQVSMENMVSNNIESIDKEFDQETDWTE